MQRTNRYIDSDIRLLGNAGGDRTRNLRQWYELTIPYLNEKSLDDTIIEFISETENTADSRNSFSEIGIRALDGLDRHW